MDCETFSNARKSSHAVSGHHATASAPATNALPKRRKSMRIGQKFSLPRSKGGAKRSHPPCKSPGTPFHSRFKTPPLQFILSFVPVCRERLETLEVALICLDLQGFPRRQRDLDIETRVTDS